MIKLKENPGLVAMNAPFIEPIEHGVSMGASDITLCADMPVIYRVEGQLLFGKRLPENHFNELHTFLEQTGARRHLKNHDSLSFDHDGSRFRLSYYSSEDGDTIELRLCQRPRALLPSLGSPQVS
ncbi:hypothetical protein OH491_27735 (plasmid) [Termitidicoccus mucosus]|uniref:hypothetical protein n=1 Tax=Termitidicoccus mucosus TaxID=1184151 RepID=UPI003182EA88